MNKKLMLTLSLLVVFTLSLVACGSEDTGQDQTATADKGSTTVNEQQSPNENSQYDNSEQDVARAPEGTEQTSDQITSSGDIEAEKTAKYAVNSKNYKIYAVGDEIKEEKIVLLTFDDTPTAEATYSILDNLDKYNAKAIFFVNGHYAERNVEALHEIKNRGHIIGNHTWWHIYIRKEPPEKVREEIVRLNDFLEEQLGERPTYFRPPFGQNSDVSLQVIREEGMQTMNWSNGSLDWELKTAEGVVQQVLTNISNGDNILFHDKQITAEALELILAELSARGYKFVLPTEVIVPEG